MRNHFEQEYPHISRFCHEEDIERIPYERTHQQLILKDYISHSTPAHLDNKLFTVRTMLDHCIALLYKYDALDRDRRNRLKGRDEIRFWSLVSELKVGMWLESQGFSLQFDPLARGNRRGEFKASSKRGSVFIEVKTLFGDAKMLGQQEFLSKLADYCESKGLLVQYINILEYPSDFDTRNMDVLIKNIENFILSYTREMYEDREIEYKDKDGFSIEFTLSPRATKVVSLMYGGFVGVDKQLKCKLGMQVDGRNCEVQVSIEDIPNLIIVFDHGHWTDQIIEGILYGTRVYDVRGKSEKYYREKNGLWNTKSSSLISAVGTFKETLEEKYTLDANIYLCPKPHFPLTRSLFPISAVKWWQLSPDSYSVGQIQSSKLSKVVDLIKRTIRTCVKRQT